MKKGDRIYPTTSGTIKRIKMPDDKLIKNSEQFKSYSYKELLNYEAPTYQWMVEKIVQAKKIIILGGPSAVYKSWLGLTLGLTVSKGLSFLENFPTQQGAVLFIDRENSLPELQNRIEMLSAGLDIKDDEDIPLYFISEQSIPFDNPTNREFLKEFIKTKDIKLVIVDTYRRVINFEENNADSVSLFFSDGLKPICEETGVSFILLHHHKKGNKNANPKDMLRGSSDLVNFVDGIIQIERKGPYITLIQTKNRSGKELNPIQLKVSTDEDTYFKFEYHGEKQEFTTAHRCVNVLMMWIAKEKINRFQTKEALTIAHQSGIKRQNFFNGLSELEKRGLIKKDSKGLYSVIPDNTIEGDLGIVQSPTHKSVGLLDILPPSKSISPIGLIGQVGQLENKICSSCGDSDAFIIVNDKLFCKECAYQGGTKK